MATCRVEVNSDSYELFCEGGRALVSERILAEGPTAAPGGGETLGRCFCSCEGSEPRQCNGTTSFNGGGPSIEAGEGGQQAPLTTSTEVEVRFNDIPLEQGVALIDRLVPYETYVPVSRIGERVHISVRSRPSAVLDHLGVRYERREQA